VKSRHLSKIEIEIEFLTYGRTDRQPESNVAPPPIVGGGIGNNKRLLDLWVKFSGTERLNNGKQNSDRTYSIYKLS